MVVARGGDLNKVWVPKLFTRLHSSCKRTAAQVSLLCFGDYMSNQGILEAPVSKYKTHRVYSSNSLANKSVRMQRNYPQLWKTLSEDDSSYILPPFTIGGAVSEPPQKGEVTIRVAMDCQSHWGADNL